MLREQDGYRLTLANGAVFNADYVVLATGHFAPPVMPGIDPTAMSHGVYFHDAWPPQTYDGLRAEDTVTLIGTGLTAVDVLLRLRELGFQGRIVATSRHGRFPNRHAAYVPAITSAIPLATAPTCVGYLQAFRATIHNGVEWRAAIDSLRASTNALWLALPLKEQQRFRRHLQSFWNVARHRMAPSIADIIDAELAAGTLVLRKGHVAAIHASQQDALITLRTPAGEVTFRTSRVINCMGPDTHYRRVNSPLLASLFDQGMVTAGPLGDGFNSSRSGALIDTVCDVTGTIFSIGPGRLGTLVESTAMREIAEQAIEVAEAISQQLAPTN
jgi:hydroxyacylglutathione hydrolase